MKNAKKGKKGKKKFGKSRPLSEKSGGIGKMKDPQIDILRGE